MRTGKSPRKRASTSPPGSVRFGLWIFFGLLCGVPCGMLTIGFASHLIESGYSWQDMEWNGDHRTTTGEILQSLDVGVRSIQVNGRSCREFFSLKDGRTVRLTCLE